jgi:lipoate-protein ligase A
MLLALDKTAAERYLNPNPKKLLSKGVDSVKSRIMNLTEVCPHISHESFCDALAAAFKKKHKGHACEELAFNEQELSSIEELKKIYDSTSAWLWRYGETPEFTHTIDEKFDWGLVEICFKVINGHIQEGKIYSDCLYPDFVDTFNQILGRTKTQYSRECWGKLVQEMESRCGANDMYLHFLADIKALVHNHI